MPVKKKAKPADAPAEPTAKARRRMPTVRIGHLSITLLPGESTDRIRQITEEVWKQWQPVNVVEEFDCDMIVHARFKIERYERFHDQFVASGIAAADLDRAVQSYQSTMRIAEQSMAIARENLPRPRQANSSISSDMLAQMPVKGPIQ